MADAYSSLGQELLCESDLPPSRIAKLARVPRPRVSDWRAGRCKPNPAARRRLDVTGVVPTAAWKTPPTSSPAASSSPVMSSSLPKATTVVTSPSLSAEDVDTIVHFFGAVLSAGVNLADHAGAVVHLVGHRPDIVTRLVELAREVLNTAAAPKGQVDETLLVPREPFDAAPEVKS